MRRWLVNALALALAWPFVTGSMEASAIVSGLLIGLPVAYVFRRSHSEAVDLGSISLRPVPLYLYRFLNELVKSNLDVAYRVLHPSKPVDPVEFEYSSALDNPTALTVLANSITLTPGTIVVDCTEDHRLTIHCLDGDEEAAREGIENWESILDRIFGDSR